KGGWVNLLQPQDKKSQHPGDSKEAVTARRRLLERGIAAPLVAALAALLREALAATGAKAAALLDVGCGEGTLLDGLCAALDCEGWGVDLSTPAVEAAAKRFPSRHFVIANADRGLPFTDASFPVITSITARRNAPEFARVLSPEGRVAVVVPGDDDLRELREAVQGEARPLAGDVSLDGFVVDAAREVRSRSVLDADALRDLLASTYRGQRRREGERAAALSALEVTFHWQIRIFRRA
ncbi:MAG TPA: methyltransferase domain-containing protein, partial [bacterium]|nr:methyltransferase domain-containing protein [bacterium]